MPHKGSLATILPLFVLFCAESPFMKPVPDHAVNRLRTWRKSISTRPFLARGGSVPRCEACQLRRDWCACDWRPELKAEVGFCLLMYDSEPMKPSNTGRLIADVLPGKTWAFLWSRTEPHPELLTLLRDPEWQPYVVFPASEKAPARLTEQVLPTPGKRPLFILLDGTWPEARKMFNKSPYLDALPVLAVRPESLSTYGMRVAPKEHQLCTAEVAACVLEVAGEAQAGLGLQLWFNLFSSRYMAGRVNRWPGEEDAVLQQALVPFLNPIRENDENRESTLD